MIGHYFLKSKVISRPYSVFHHYFLSEKTPGNTLADLDFDTSISRSIEKFKTHHWTRNEVLHYGFLSSVIAFVFLIFPASFLVKIPILALFITCFLVPLTSQFFLHALPIFAWLAFYFTCGKIPATWKPAISVQVLPAMETILYGDNLSNVLATFNTPFLDILAWIPYGIVHFSAPFVVAALIFLFGPPTSLRSFGFAFGYMNLLGVIVQIMFPAAPPWYKNLYGLAPANYAMSGSPGGLGRIDQILGVDMYTTAFSNSPVIFGAFPSLHSGCAVMDVLFLSWLFPKFKVLWWGYSCWLWWSTMYLTHHYFIDLTCGAALSFAVFEYTKYTWLPVISQEKFCRWSYTKITKSSMSDSDPLAMNFAKNDIESNLAPSNNNYPYFLNPNMNSEFEMESMSRSRQASRSYLPSSSGGLSASVYQQAKSTSSLNLPISEEEPVMEIETSSLENSGTPSVFDDDQNRISTTGSNTSLDEIDHSVSASKSTPTNNENNNKKFNKYR